MIEHPVFSFPDPLENLDRFSIPLPVPKKLPVVSVVFESRENMMPRIRRITEWHRKFFQFHREVVISTKDPGIPGTEFLSCGETPPFEDFEYWYSDVCLRWLVQVCDAPHVLMWQWDGFILNPYNWLDEFLDYDYVGHPVSASYWPEMAKGFSEAHPEWKNPLTEIPPPWVGNGGFSLRSKRLLEVISDMAWKAPPRLAEAEDMFICVEKRNELEAQGIKFPSVELASRFASWEKFHRFDKVFGFHGYGLVETAKQYLEMKHSGGMDNARTSCDEHQEQSETVEA